MIHFTINLTPKAQKRARSRAITSNGRSYAMTYKDKEQRLEEDKLIPMLLEHRPPAPLSGPLCLGVRCYLPIPASKSNRWQLQAGAGIIRPTTKPDLDNLLKHLKDCMKGIFWLDDKQVVEYLTGTGKYYSSIPRWEITLIPLPPG